MRPANSGDEGKPITFEAFGDGEVIVSGCETVTGWSAHRDGIFKAAVADPVIDVFMDGQPMLMACHPNQPYSSEKGFNRLAWKRGTANPPAGVDWKGSYAMRPAMAWSIHKVDAWEDNPEGLLMGPLGLLDSDGEWAWREGVLYFKPPGGKNPESLKIERKVREYGFDLSGRSHVVVTGVTIRGATVNLDRASHCSVEKSRILFHGPFFTVAKPWREESSFDTFGKGVILGGNHNTLIKNRDRPFLGRRSHRLWIQQHRSGLPYS